MIGKISAADISSPIRSPQARTRPRGFIEWTPRPDTRELLTAVDSVMWAYADHLPLTIRQIYYRLVATEVLLDKDEPAYRRLCEHLSSARRAGRIAFEHIRDDGADLPWSLLGNAGAGDLGEALAACVRYFELDQQTDQRRRLLLACEAAGMRPQLERVASPYGVTVIAGGGFDSLTAKHGLAKLIAETGVAFEILHVGDFDPSGEHVFSALAEDVSAFVETIGGDVRFTRLAVTPEQIRLYDLPTALPKAGDQRTFSGERTAQAEGLPPDILADLVERAIRERLDLELVAETKRRGALIRADAEARLRVAGVWHGLGGAS